MSRPVICVENLSKWYYKGKDDSLKAALTQGLSRLAQGRWLAEREGFWALKDVSFELKEGEAMGLVGRNGSGKSTLLKILSGVTEPTRGRVLIQKNARLLSILEVGAGFHPDFTGRENIYLNGSLLGLSSREIGKKLDEMAAFSGVESFIDTPVKHYSSGMYVRLAFSIVAFLDADILIFDEVTSVGDAEFRAKSFEKMRELVSAGKTLLIVSHNLNDLIRACDSGAWLDAGRLVAQDDIGGIANRYLAQVALAENIGEHETRETFRTPEGAFATRKISWLKTANAPGNEWARLLSVAYWPTATPDRNALFTDDEISVEIIYELTQAERWVDGGFLLLDAAGSVLATFTPMGLPNHNAQPRKPGWYKTLIQIPANWLCHGDFQLNFFLIIYPPPDGKFKAFWYKLVTPLRFKVRLRKDAPEFLTMINSPFLPSFEWKAERIDA